MNLKKTLFLLIITLFSLQFKGQSVSYKSFYKVLFSGNYKKAASNLIVLRKEQANNIRTNIAFADFFYIMYKTSGGMEIYNTLCKKEAKIIEKTIPNKKNLKPFDVFYIISAKSLTLKIEFDKKHYLKVAKGFQELIKYFKYSLNHPNNQYLKLINGMYYYYVATAKKDYPITKPVLHFFPSGNPVKGLRLLYESSKSNNLYIRISAKLFLANIYQSKHDFVKANYFYTNLLKEYPLNLHWRKYYIKFLKEFNKVEKAKEQQIILLKILNSNSFFTKYQIKYLKTE